MSFYVVTGGAGFIGSHLAEELERRGERIRIVDSLITGKRSNIAHVRSAEFVGRPCRDRRRTSRGGGSRLRAPSSCESVRTSISEGSPVEQSRQYRRDAECSGGRARGGREAG